MRAPLPVTLLTGMDPVLRDSVAFTVLADVPDAVVLRHDLSQAVTSGVIRRVVSDASGVVEDVAMPLEHSCLGCALREDVLPTLVRLAGTGRWNAALLALPVGGEPLPVLRAMAGGVVGRVPVAAVAQAVGVVAVTSRRSLAEDLFGDDLLGERDLAHGDDDRRSVGEVLAHQLEMADLVLVDDDVDGTGVVPRLLSHLLQPRVRLAGGPHEVSGADVLAWRRDAAESLARTDPRRVNPTGAVDSDGVWTRDLRTWRPLHPGRLHERLEQIGAGRIRGRGHFWLPGRPGTVAGWDGAGGQLSIGDCGGWGSAERGTRLVLTGVDQGDADRVAEAFASITMTDAELARGRAWWTAQDDGFDPWLGEQVEAA